jgi:hypothetical protein
MHETKVNTNHLWSTLSEAKKAHLSTDDVGKADVSKGIHNAVAPGLPHLKPIQFLSGISVAQLLHDIDEASVGTNPVELFRLCLDAQRVLVQVQAGNTTPDEAKLLAAYRSSDDDSRHFLQSAAQTLAQDFKRQRARLTLVQSSQIQRAEAV